MKRTRILLSLLFASFFASLVAAFAGPTEIIWLSGKGPATAVPWDFFCTKGLQSGYWTNIAVPSNWELQGFGGYDYGHVKQKHDEHGLYRYVFKAPSEWKGRRVRLVFDGVMTDTDVKINGQSAGPVHQGGFYRFRYDITSLLNFGSTNLLEVEVSKKSANASVEAAERMADYWVFGGIFRPVFLEIVPDEFLDRVAINAGADGMFAADVFPGHIAGADHIVGRIESADGIPVSDEFRVSVHPGDTNVSLSTKIQNPNLWSAETPNLYQFRATLIKGNSAIHELVTRFGFRTFEVRAGQGLFLNGRRILLKGFDRHCFRPETGRALNPEDSYEDARLLKSINANAVRCSHYPPDRSFLDACDELGLYVIDELCCWQKPILDTPIARLLVRELVERDVNDPSILFWSNGNEGGFNFDVDDDFALYDPRKRHVLHPWADFRGLDTAHYRIYEEHLKKLEGPSIYMPTEFLHGLYDGGMGAGLEDYWDATLRSKFGGGGFLWVFADEGVVRTDQGGRIDTDGNHAPDGILGPHHEHEGSYDTVRNIWSPVQILMNQLPDNFVGLVPVENRYAFLPLSAVKFEWALVNYPSPGESTEPEPLASGSVASPAIAPGSRGSLDIPLPRNWRKADALRLVATGRDDVQVMNWVWPIQDREKFIGQAFNPGRSPGAVKAIGEEGFRVQSGNTDFEFSKQTGQLIKVSSGGKSIAFQNGPRLVAESATGQIPSLSSDNPGAVKVSTSAGMATIEAKQTAGLEQFKWTVKPGGILELDYQGNLPPGEYYYSGIAFDLADKEVKSKRWLGGGPFRVWKNRLTGPTFGRWENNWNNGVAGEVWDLPEFKGIFKEVVWMRLAMADGAVTIGLKDPDAFLGVLRPPNGSNPSQCTYFYPHGDGLFVFNSIPAIGNKFHPASKVGPQSQPTHMEGRFHGSIVLHFE